VAVPWMPFLCISLSTCGSPVLGFSGSVPSLYEKSIHTSDSLTGGSCRDGFFSLTLPMSSESPFNCSLSPRALAFAYKTTVLIKLLSRYACFFSFLLCLGREAPAESFFPLPACRPCGHFFTPITVVILSILSRCQASHFFFFPPLQESRVDFQLSFALR